MLISNQQWFNQQTLIMIISAVIVKRKYDREVNIVLLITLTIIGCMGMLAIIGTTSILYVAGKGASKVVNYTDESGSCVLLYSNQEVPLKLEDLGLGITDYDYIESIADIDSGFFMSIRDYSYYERHDNYMEKKQDRGISYKIVESDYQWVLNQYITYESDEQKYDICEKKEIATAWGADQAYIRIPKRNPEDSEEEYQEYESDMFLVYRNKIVVLSGDYTFSLEEIEIIREKLDI